MPKEKLDANKFMAICRIDELFIQQRIGFNFYII